VYKPCKDTSVCGDMRIVSNSHHVCNKGFCDWGACSTFFILVLLVRPLRQADPAFPPLTACNSGFYRSSNKCYKSASSSTSSSSTKQASTSSGNQLAASSSNVLVSSGVNKFLGTNTGAIASWFRTNSAADSTNGASSLRTSPSHSLGPD